MARYSRSLGSTGPCRVGDQLAARFPLQLADAASARQRLESEAEAARELLGRTRFAAPEVVAIGEPGAGYPLSWSVQTWLSGVVAVDDDPATCSRRVNTAFRPCGVRSPGVCLVSATQILDHVPSSPAESSCVSGHGSWP